MEGLLLELFTSPTCPFCPRAREAIGEAVKTMKNALLIEREVTDSENANLAKKYGIQSVPTLIINGAYRIEGVPQREDLMRFLRQI
ncbi:MAG: thioredoxin family protein [Candidatus Hydrothermarchaeota archaeon]|nr:thioredoxin family protein [Candidatus Hydrothermarchaeota archaeon]MDP6613208.1 thioredoxin family protein [Candidatus Hydrothermarchaeota archaeon]